MAGTTRRDVELRINANDLSGKQLGDLLDTFDKLRQSQEQFIKSGDASQRSMRELTQELNDLRAIALELKSRAGLVDLFEDAKQRASDAAARVEKARDALAKFNAAQKDGAELTKKQQTEFNRLTREVQKAEGAFASSQSKVEQLKEELSQIGAGDTDATRQALLRFSDDLARAMGQAEQSIRNYDAALRRQRDSEQKATEAKKQQASVEAQLAAARAKSAKALAEQQAEADAQIADAKKKADAAQAQLKRTLAFQEQGRDAAQAAASIEALSKDYDALAVSSRKAGDSIRTILDPSRQAMGELGGLEQQVQKLNTQLAQAQSSGKLREEIRKLRSEYTSLAADAGKAAAALADDIGRYRQAEQALGTLRTQVTAAQQAVMKLGTQMSASGAPSEELANDLHKAEASLKTLVGEFERQSQSLANLRGRLREAGVDVNKLAEAERRLEGVARGVSTAQQSLGVAMVDLGRNAKTAAQGVSLFDDVGRKSLSSAQRLRGEVLSLAQSYVGLYAAIQAGQGAIEAAVTREQILRRFELVEGSVEAARAQYDKLRATADQLGLPFQEVADGLSRVAISAKESGISTERLDRFLMSLGKTTRALGLDAEATKGVWLAVSQVFDKTTLQAEELRGQMAERLAGVVAVAAKALSMNAEELDKAVRNGVLGVQDLMVIIDEYASRVDKLSDNTETSATRALILFKNAVYDLKLALADTGFLEAMVKLMKEFAQAAKDGRLQGAVEGLGTLLRLAAEAALFLLNNVELTIAAFSAFIALNAAKLILGIAASLKTLGVGFTLSAGGAALLRVAIIALPIVGLIAAFVTWAAQSETVRAAMSALWTVVKELGGILADIVTLNFDGFAERTAQAWQRIKNAISGVADEAERARNNLPPEPKASTPKGGRGAVGQWGREGGATGAWEDDSFERAENKRLAAHARAAKQAGKIEEDLAKVSIAADKEVARAKGDILAQVRAEYEEHYRAIDELAKHDKARADALRAKLDKDVMRIVATRKAQEAGKFTRGERGEQAALLEREKQAAERVKDAAEFRKAILEQEYREGLVNLRDYYDQRKAETIKGLDAEINAAENQLKILQANAGRDPQAAKRIEETEGRILSLTQQKMVAERQFAFEAQQGEQALREQMNNLEKELHVLTGDEVQAGMREVLDWQAKQFDWINKLTDAERERQLVLLNNVVYIKSQLVLVQQMAKEAQGLNALRQAAVDAATAQGDLSYLQQLQAQSEVNRETLKTLEAQAEKYRQMGPAGARAYEEIMAQIIRLRAETDLLANEITQVFQGAAHSLVQTLIETKSPKDALKAFGKSLASSITKTFTDEASQAITKWLKEMGAMDMFKSLLGGIGGLFKAGHTGAVVGHTGMARRAVSPLAFLGAPRYHSGGLPGLRRDEVAMIAKKGEEILTENNPRHIRNAGQAQQVAAGPTQLVVDPSLMRLTMQEALERMLATAQAGM